jgi:hypothetical protein
LIPKPDLIACASKRATVMAATDQRTTSGPAGPLNPRTKAEDMTAPTILAKLPRKPLISGRRPDMARKPGHREEHDISR